MFSESTVPAILLVEDQPDDVVLMRLALRMAEVRNPFFAVYDGYEAIEYLKGTGRYADRQTYPLPGLMLLDIKMPRIDGFGVLRWLQGQPQHDSIAVVVLSSSSLETDIATAKRLGADDYQVKPNSHAELVRIVSAVIARWIGAECKSMPV